MKFSYKLLKRINSRIPEKKKVLELLTNYSFEAEDLKGEVIDISILPNRYSDASSHYGIAQEIMAALQKKSELPDFGSKFGKKGKELEIKVLEKGLCKRYIGAVIEIEKNTESPLWMREILEDVGMRPINLVVDIMNYVMLLTGQPMHAFDFDKIADLREISVGSKRIKKEKIIVRLAKDGEEIETLDNRRIKLDKGTLIIADEKKPLAIAGIKGGKRAEVDEKTKKIIVEAASFSQVNIFKTSKRVGISTDASLRFSHNLSSELAKFGMNEALKLFKEFAGGKVKEIIDADFSKKEKKDIYFDVKRFVNFTGIKDLNVKMAAVKLKFLGFLIKKISKDGFIATPPILRNDVLNFQDLAEETARVYGVNKIKPEAPNFIIYPPIENNLYVMKEKVRDILSGLALDEVYNYTFVAEGGVNLENPISAERKHLRVSLKPLLIKNVIDNFRFFDKVAIFELGKIFNNDGKEISENFNLGIVVAHKKDNLFLELKGVVEELLRKLGLTDFDFKEEEGKLLVLAGGEAIGGLTIEKKDGYKMSIAEINLERLEKKTEEELEYEEIIKYPSITRDLSFLVGSEIRVGEILKEIQGVDFQEIRDVDMIDFYEDEKLGDNLKSLTFRIVLQSKEKSLTDEEADRIIEKIVKMLEEKFGAEVR
ncbi:MAG: phenylalanine--tRNA ligase subunit beta [Candidatus Pacebacteria bacterium]|nr:phenylalanine--tRNA ligase subunit beta [Candidatus Paceibacterota bacterium]